MSLTGIHRKKHAPPNGSVLFLCSDYFLTSLFAGKVNAMTGDSPRRAADKAVAAPAL